MGLLLHGHQTQLVSYCHRTSDGTVEDHHAGRFDVHASWGDALLFDTALWVGLKQTMSHCH